MMFRVLAHGTGRRWTLTSGVHPTWAEHARRRASGAPGRIRPADASLRTAALYPLSYGGARPVYPPASAAHSPGSARSSAPERPGVAARRRSDAGAAAADELEDQHDDRQHEQQMDEPPADAPDEAEQPQHQEDRNDREQHGSFSHSTSDALGGRP